MDIYIYIYIYKYYLFIYIFLIILIKIVKDGTWRQATCTTSINDIMAKL